MVATWQLAIFPKAPQYLTRRPHRMGAGFRKAGAIENQHATTLGNDLAHATPDPVGVPRCVRDEVLKGLIRDRLGDASQHRLHRLSIAVAEDALDVASQRHQP